jgi:apolipoprotein N-acyltransferase
MPGRLSLKALAERLAGLSGWRRRLAAFIAGAASVFALAPFFAWPVLWLTLPAFVWLLDGAMAGREQTRRPWLAKPWIAAAAVGWWWGFGYFLAGLFWIGEAFLVEAGVFVVIMPFAVVLMPAGLAIFYAGAAALVAPFRHTGIYRVLALALSLAAMEWMRGHVLSGFPWNVLGYALTHPLPLMQSAAVLGIYGLTLVVVVIFALPPVLWCAAGDRRARFTAAAVACVPLIAMAGIGQARLAMAASDRVPGVKIRIVQPSVPQREKWIAGNQERIFLEHIDLSRRDAGGTIDNLAGVTHVVWPEAAMPFMPLDTPAALGEIAGLLPEGTVLISGALRAQQAPPKSPRLRDFFNSMLVFGKGALLITLYDKIVLVPFGEFLPLRNLLEAVGLRHFAYAMGSFEAGGTPRALLDIPGLPSAVPLICYEAIFPGAVVRSTGRPGVIINLTNDGWFGNTTGPRQHLHQARVRAVEEGLPLIRAANNGISGAFDGYGRALGRLDLNVRGVLDVPLPVALQMPIYARFGDFLFFTLWLLGAAILGRVVWRLSHTRPHASR